MDWFPNVDISSWFPSWTGIPSPKDRPPRPPNPFDSVNDIRDRPDTRNSQANPAPPDEIMSIFEYFAMLIRKWLGLFGPGNGDQNANDEDFGSEELDSEDDSDVL